jgi:hypothetical protein
VLNGRKQRPAKRARQSAGPVAAKGIPS